MTTYTNGKQKVEYSKNLPDFHNVLAEIKARRVILSNREGLNWINLPLWVVIFLVLVEPQLVVLFVIVALFRSGQFQLVRTENETAEAHEEHEAELV